MMLRDRSHRLAVVVALAVTAVLLLPGPVFGHAELESATPADLLTRVAGFTNDYIARLHGRTNMFATCFLGAIDPMTGKSKWEVPSDIPRFSGVLSTAGGVVFTGRLTGEFEAFDAKSGKKLWQFKTGSGIEGQPVTWEQDGVQYVAVTSGIGGVYSLFSGDARLAKVPAGGSLWVFALQK